MKPKLFVLAVLLTAIAHVHAGIDENPPPPEPLFPNLELFHEFLLPEGPEHGKPTWFSFRLTQDWWESDLAVGQGFPVTYAADRGVYLVLARITDRAEPLARLCVSHDPMPEGGMPAVYKEMYGRIRNVTGKGVQGKAVALRRRPGAMKGYEWEFEHEKFLDGARTHVMTLGFNGRVFTVVYEYGKAHGGIARPEFEKLVENLDVTIVRKKRGAFALKRMFVRDHPECRVECFYARGRQDWRRDRTAKVPTWYIQSTRSSKQLAHVRLKETSHDSAYGLERRTEALEELKKNTRMQLQSQPDVLDVVVDEREYGLLPAWLFTVQYRGERSKQTSLRLITVTPFMTVEWSYDGRESLKTRGLGFILSTDYEFRPQAKTR